VRPRTNKAHAKARAQRKGRSLTRAALGLGLGPGAGDTPGVGLSDFPFLGNRRWEPRPPEASNWQASRRRDKPPNSCEAKVETRTPHLAWMVMLAVVATGCNSMSDPTTQPTSTPTPQSRVNVAADIHHESVAWTHLRVSADGKTLTVHAADQCRGITPRIRESQDAVVVELVTTWVAGLHGCLPMTTEGHDHSINLFSPLGTRSVKHAPVGEVPR